MDGSSQETTIEFFSDEINSNQYFDEVKKIKNKLLRSNKKHMSDFKKQIEQHQKVIEDLISSNANFMDTSRNMVKAASHQVLFVEKEIKRISERHKK